MIKQNDLTETKEGAEDEIFQSYTSLLCQVPYPNRKYELQARNHVH